MSQRAFNVPTLVLVITGLFFALHLLGIYDKSYSRWLWLNFGFFPLEKFLYSALYLPLPSSITYAFLHSDWVHLMMNSFMFLAFATPLAKRISPLKLIIFMLFMAFAGAFVHLLTHYNEKSVLIGASAITSGLFAACIRLPYMGAGEYFAAPLIPLKNIFSDSQQLTTIIVWAVVNYLFGSGLMLDTGESKIAWEAHIGGFLVGLVLMNLFDKKSGSETEPLEGEGN